MARERLAFRHLLALLQKWRTAEISSFELFVLAAAVPVRLFKWRLLGVMRSTDGMFLTRRELLDVAICHAAGRPGLWLEFGVFEGDSLNYIAGRVDFLVYGFDSFEGLPSRWGLQYKQGAFSTGGHLPEIRPNVRLVKGWFKDSLPAFLEGQSAAPVAFAHVDSDLYESARVVLFTLGDRIGPGTILLFDEFCGMQPDDESRAFREFERKNRLRFRYVGCALEGGGSVALEILSPPDRLFPRRH